MMKRAINLLAFAGFFFTACQEKVYVTDPNHVHFMHQSCGGGIMNDHSGVDEHPDPDEGLRTQLENAGHEVTDNIMSDSRPWDDDGDNIASLFADDGADLPEDAREAGILMFKSCYYPIGDLDSDEVLESWKQAFLDYIVPYAEAHPEQVIIAMPAVPYREQDTDQANHDRARQWADWLADEFFDTAPANVTSFDLFDIWADPENNWLKEEYEGNESHPNAYAYLLMADSIAAFIAELTASAE